MEELSEVLDLSDSRSPSDGKFQENLGGVEQREVSKRPMMRDLDSVMRFRGIKKCSKLSEISKEEGDSQVTDSAASLHTVPVQLVESTTSTCLSLGVVNSVKPSENLLSNMAPNRFKEPKTHEISSSGLNLDLNDNPFHPYKKLGQTRSTDPSECGSTTGPLEESEPLRLWKQMKQNGFLSSTHGRIPAPKPRGRQPKRKREEEIKKKNEPLKQEQVNKYCKNAAPTGLLSGLNPGIIKHVRNSKQVNSIIEAMLQFEKSDSQVQNRTTEQFGGGSRDASAHNSAGNRFSLFPDRPLSSMPYGESSAIPLFNMGYDDSLALRLASALPMASENASSASKDALSSATPDVIASLSLKGASVASQWLDLLQHDIKGRLAALRRSKKRVRNVIHTELPYLLSKEISSNQEKDDNLSQSSEAPSKEIMNSHMARWKSIFSQMDKALYEEGKHLENWLKQVQDMQSHCGRGLKCVDASRAVVLPEGFSGLKKTEAVDREHAIRAAAASIFSACNFISTKENVPCF